MIEIALSPLQVRVHDVKNYALGISDLEKALARVAGQFVPLAWARDKASLILEHEGNHTIEFWADIVSYFSKNLRIRCLKRENLARVCSSP